MPDHGNRRAREAMLWQALKGSLSSAFRKVLFFSYMPSAEPKVTGKQKAEGNAHLAWPVAALHLHLLYPPHPALLVSSGWLQKGEHHQEQSLEPQLHSLVGARLRETM